MSRERNERKTLDALEAGWPDEIETEQLARLRSAAKGRSAAASPASSAGPVQPKLSVAAGDCSVVDPAAETTLAPSAAPSAPDEAAASKSRVATPRQTSRSRPPWFSYSRPPQSREAAPAGLGPSSLAAYPRPIRQPLFEQARTERGDELHPAAGPARLAPPPPIAPTGPIPARPVIRQAFPRPSMDMPRHPPAVWSLERPADPGRSDRPSAPLSRNPPVALVRRPTDAALSAPREPDGPGLPEPAAEDRPPVGSPLCDWPDPPAAHPWGTSFGVGLFLLGLLCGGLAILLLLQWQPFPRAVRPEPAWSWANRATPPLVATPLTALPADPVAPALPTASPTALASPTLAAAAPSHLTAGPLTSVAVNASPPLAQAPDPSPPSLPAAPTPPRSTGTEPEVTPAPAAPAGAVQVPVRPAGRARQHKARTLPAEAPPLAPGHGYLVITARPGTIHMIGVGGQERGRPPLRLALPEGLHEVKVIPAQGYPSIRLVKITDQQTFTLDLTPRSGTPAEAR